MHSGMKVRTAVVVLSLVCLCDTEMCFVLTILFLLCIRLVLDV